jgi:hypothetical protein
MKGTNNNKKGRTKWAGDPRPSLGVALFYKPDPRSRASCAGGRRPLPAIDQNHKTLEEGDEDT